MPRNKAFTKYSETGSQNEPSSLVRLKGHSMYYWTCYYSNHKGRERSIAGISNLGLKASGCRFQQLVKRQGYHEFCNNQGVKFSCKLEQRHLWVTDKWTCSLLYKIKYLLLGNKNMLVIFFWWLDPIKTCAYIFYSKKQIPLKYYTHWPLMPQDWWTLHQVWWMNTCKSCFESLDVKTFKSLMQPTAVSAWTPSDKLTPSNNKIMNPKTPKPSSEQFFTHL